LIAQPVMSNNNVKIVNLLTSQPLAYDFESNRPSPVTFWNGGSPNVNNKTTIVVVKLLEEEKQTLERLALPFSELIFHFYDQHVFTIFR